MMRRLQALALLLLLGAPPAGTANASEPAARVAPGVVVHLGQPALRIQVPANATYAGAERFDLYGVADAEIHLFVEADEQMRVRRYYWVQFESYLPARQDHRYSYGQDDRRMEAWGEPLWVRTFLSRTERPARAGSDSEAVRRILKRGGYSLPPNLMMARLVRLLDDPQGTGFGRSELMLIYAEDMSSTGLTIDDVTAADGTSNSRWEALEKPLIERAIKAFSVAPARVAAAVERG